MSWQGHDGAAQLLLACQGADVEQATAGSWSVLADASRGGRHGAIRSPCDRGLGRRWPLAALTRKTRSSRPARESVRPGCPGRTLRLPRCLAAALGETEEGASASAAPAGAARWAAMARVAHATPGSRIIGAAPELRASHGVADLF